MTSSQILMSPHSVKCGSGRLPNRISGTGLTSAAVNRRAERPALWQDSSLFQDSFFAPDSRTDGFAQSDFGALSASAASAPGQIGAAVHGSEDDEIAGVVVDSPPANRPTHH